MLAAGRSRGGSTPPAARGVPPSDPGELTGYSLVFSAVALPLTDFTVLVIANDPDYVGEKTNSWLSNGLGTIYLVLTTVAAVAAVPLMLITKAGA